MKNHEPFYHIPIISDSLHNIATPIMYKISLSYFNFEQHMFSIEKIQLGREITCIVLLHIDRNNVTHMVSDNGSTDACKLVESLALVKIIITAI
jgi:hypothetical protein